LLEGEDPIREAVAFHCQQASEKYLKDLSGEPPNRVPKTHNMRLLLDLVAGVAPEMAESLAGAAVLTPYGVDIRYPSDFPEVIPGQEAVLYELAGRVRAAVTAMLKKGHAGS
jgi:HEPN domain-containing protein